MKPIIKVIYYKNKLYRSYVELYEKNKTENGLAEKRMCSKYERFCRMMGH